MTRKQLLKKVEKLESDQQKLLDICETHNDVIEALMKSVKFLQEIELQRKITRYN